MLPLLPILGFAVEHAPDLIGLLGGEKAGATASAVVNAAKGIFGTTDPAQIQAQVQADNNKLEEFKSALQAVIEEHSADLADTQNARNMALGLAQAGSKMSWGPAVISALVIFGFTTFTSMFLLHPPSVNDPAVFAVITSLNGTLSAALGAVVQFWVGSSNSSRTKDAAFSGVVMSAHSLVGKFAGK